MMSAHDTPVAAQVSGSVVFSANRAGGLAFHLSGDDGTFHYGVHLSAYGAEGAVAAGTVIGYVGATGNARGSPYLHFEVHPGGQGNAINPYPTGRPALLTVGRASDARLHADVWEPLHSEMARFTPILQATRGLSGHDTARLVPRVVERAAASAFGHGPFRRQVEAHAFHAMGEALFAVSLAGSLFFSVSVDAARPRIILYLLLTMAPFAVLAPLIGPSIDRMPGGHRMVIIVTCGGRAVIAWFLASDLDRLLLYPEAIAILVLGKAYSVAKNALVPRLIEQPDELVGANARLARTATIAGAVGGAGGAGLLVAAGAPMVLRVGAFAYLAGSLLAFRVPRSAPRARLPALEYAQLHAPGLRLAAAAMATLRAAVGLLTFHLGFTLKRSGEPPWLFGLIFAAAGAGGFLGTFAAARLRRRFGERAMLALALVAPALAAAFAAWRGQRFSVIVLAFVLGMAAAVGRHAFDSLVQREAPAADRGRAFARFETGFQLAWVAGALVAVAARPPAWAGHLVLSTTLAAAATWYLSGLRVAGRERVLAPARPLPSMPIVELLEAAGAAAEVGQHRLAVVNAHAAATAAWPDLADVQGGSELLALWRRALHTDQVTAVDSGDALRLASEITAARA